MKIFQIVIIIHAVLDSLEASISKGKSYIELSSSKVFLTRSLYFKRELYLNSSLATGSPDQKPKGVLNQNTYMLNEISLEATISKGISYLEFSLSKANPDQKPPLKDGIIFRPCSWNRESYLEPFISRREFLSRMLICYQDFLPR